MNEKYSHDLLKNPNNAFAIEKLSFSSAPTKRLTHFHDFFEILFVYSGKKTVGVNKVSSILDSTHIAFIAPYKFHYTDSVNSDSKRLLINFKYDFIKTPDNTINNNLLACFNSPTSVVGFSKSQISIISDLFQKMLFEYNSITDSISNAMNRMLLSQLLLTATRALYPSEITDSSINLSAHYDIIFKIASYIKTNFNENITLDSLANQFNISKFTISREFKNIIGLSFVDYTNGVRIQQAQNLLENNFSKNITEIAFQSGFNSLTQFERVFKKIVGFTPSEYTKINN